MTKGYRVSVQIMHWDEKVELVDTVVHFQSLDALGADFVLLERLAEQARTAEKEMGLDVYEKDEEDDF